MDPPNIILVANDINSRVAQLEKENAALLVQLEMLKTTKEMSVHKPT